MLTVGNYVGNGGAMVFNTVLGNSSSASDKLVITGTTNVKIANINGLSAQTTGNGILLWLVPVLDETLPSKTGQSPRGA